MKRRLYLLLLLCLPLALFGENISLEKAKEIGISFMKRNLKTRSVSDLHLVYDGETQASRNAGAAPAFYVFNHPSGRGFVVVAGDDIAAPILGFSAENCFPKDIPTNVEGWLDGLKEEINEFRERGVESDSRASADDASIGQIITQLETAQWNQNAPYNNYTPKIEGKQSPTGCVITATAIVMKFHQWPEKGTGTVPGYTTDNGKATLEERTLGHVYNWSQMPDKFKSGSYTNEQAHQVAQLMSDLGIMLQANYDANSTGAVSADIGPLLVNYMDYDKSVLYRDRYNYSTSDWTQMMKKELDENRPVIYSGRNDESGHAFVLDGYTSNDYFSVNWGWGSYCDGYFLLNAMRPSGSGIGGNNSHYNYNQAAVVGLKKNEGGDYVVLMGLGENGLSTSTTEFNQNQSFEVQIDRLSNKGGTDFTGSVIYALTNKEGVIKEILHKYNMEGLKPRWGWSNLNTLLSITQEIEIGDRIRLFFKSQEATEWTLITGGDDCTWEILVTDEYSIEETTRLHYDKSTRKLAVTTKEGVSVGLRNESGSAVEGTGGTADYETVFDTQSLPAGTYTLKLSKAFEYKEVKLKFGQPSSINP